MKRGAIALIVIAAVLIAVPLVIRNEFYINLASQILIYALLAVSLNLLLGYGGMVSLGHASFLGLTAYATIAVLHLGRRPPLRRDPRDRVLDLVRRAVRRAGAARLRHRLPDDHARARADRVGHRVSRQHADRRRQRPALSVAPAPVRHRHRERAEILLVHPDRVRDRAVRDLAAHPIAVRRRAAGRARPAAPHAHARA